MVKDTKEIDMKVEAIETVDEPHKVYICPNHFTICLGEFQNSDESGKAIQDATNVLWEVIRGYEESLKR